MSGVGLLGTMLLGTGYIYPTGTLSADAWIAYNGYVFPNVEVIEGSYSNSNIELSSFETIRTDGSGYDGVYKTAKTIIFKGYIISTDCETLESDIDSMLMACSERFGILQKRRRSGVVTVANATCAVEFGERRDTSFFMPYTVTMTILDPFMYEETLIEETREYTAPGSNSFTVTAGNEKAKPFVLIQCGTSTSVTSISIEVNGTAITCPIALTNGDRLLLNAKNKEVMKNGSQNFEFMGEFPSLKFGTNTINISYTGTLEADVYLLYYPTYA